jgi:hypothetical protein
MPLKDIKPRLKTGDLILFKALDNPNSIFIGSYYTHVGVVYIDPEFPNLPLICEAAHTKYMYTSPGRDRSGIFVEPLIPRVTKYRGYVFYKEYKRKVPDWIIVECKKFLQYAKEKMYYNNSVLSNGIKKIIGYEKCNKATNCGEFTMLMLMKLKIIDLQEYDTARYHLKYICDLPGYHTPKYISYDPFDVESIYLS